MWPTTKLFLCFLKRALLVACWWNPTQRGKPWREPHQQWHPCPVWTHPAAPPRGSPLQILFTSQVLLQFQESPFIAFTNAGPLWRRDEVCHLKAATSVMGEKKTWKKWPGFCDRRILESLGRFNYLSEVNLIVLFYLFENNNSLLKIS